MIPLHSITKPPSFNSTQVKKKEDSQFDTIDEEIIQEHILIDPTKLNEKFSHLDCEINPSLDKNLRDKLCEIIDDNKETFATAKLDVGQYKNSGQIRHRRPYSFREKKVHVGGKSRLLR
jgi:hypothetical protein